MKSLLVTTLLIVSSHRAAFADSTAQLIVTLETPDNAIPELFCVIAEQKCEGSLCTPMTALKDAMTVTDEHAAFDVTALARPTENPAVELALQSLSRSPATGCESCQPTMQLTDELRGWFDIGHPAEYIACARNGRTTHSDRVALAALKFNRVATSPVPIRAVQLDGNQVTINFLRAIKFTDYQFLIGVGGDYSPDTTGVGNGERMTLRLNPRCTLAPIQIPGRIASRREVRSVQLDDAPIDRCVEDAHGATSVWLPLDPATPLKRLRIDYASPDDPDATNSYEATWTDAAPPHLLVVQPRQITFSWRKACLSGTLPAGSNPSWSAACPRATLPLAGVTCSLQDAVKTCHYACRAADTMPAFALPTPVHFERWGAWSPHERPVYDWHDTLAYAGQELTAFLDPAQAKVIVELPDREAWRSRFGNELERVEISVDGQPAQILLLGDKVPPWATIAAPNASCSPRFSIAVVGARSFARKEQGLDTHRHNLVLATVRTYRDRFHWTAAAGGGVLGSLNDRLGGFHGQPFLSVSVGGQGYFARPFSGALEADVFYEPAFAAYGALRLSRREDNQFVNVPYHRIGLELAGSVWGANREWEAGVRAGLGAGGPMFSAVEQVGDVRWFRFVGLFHRARPGAMHAWVESYVTLRWGERHEYFGTDAQGAAIADTFHGEPVLTERAPLQLCAGLRWRMEFQ